MGITARVQHHPARAVFLPRLLEALAPLPTEVIIDPEPYELASPWRTYLACLADPPDCSHLLIVQDDAVPCRGFTAAVEQVALANPDTPVCLFISREARNSRIALMSPSRAIGLPRLAKSRIRQNAQSTPRDILSLPVLSIFIRISMRKFFGTRLLLLPVGTASRQL